MKFADKSTLKLQKSYAASVCRNTERYYIFDQFLYFIFVFDILFTIILITLITLKLKFR